MLEREGAGFGGPLGRVDEIDDMDFVRQVRNLNPMVDNLMRMQEQIVLDHQDLMIGAPANFPAFLNPREHRDMLFGHNYRGAPGAYGGGIPNMPDLQ